MGAFGYSDQEGASASITNKKLPRARSKAAEVLMSIQNKISRAKKKSLVGTRIRPASWKGSSTESDLLLEAAPRCTRPGDWTAKFRERLSEVKPSPKRESFNRCRITAAHDYDLVAKII